MFKTKRSCNETIQHKLYVHFTMFLCQFIFTLLQIKQDMWIFFIGLWRMMFSDIWKTKASLRKRNGRVFWGTVSAPWRQQKVSAVWFLQWVGLIALLPDGQTHITSCSPGFLPLFLLRLFNHLVLTVQSWEGKPARFHKYNYSRISWMKMFSAGRRI